MAKIITFEGIDCAGKGTQIILTEKHLQRLHLAYQVSREPGGTPYGTVLRALLKHPNLTIGAIYRSFAHHSDFTEIAEMVDDSENIEHRTHLTELYMFLAARAEYVDKIIRPALDAGKILISDRFYDSTRAYQGGGRFKGDQEIIEMIDASTRLIMRSLGPVQELTLFLDIPIMEMLSRMNKESDEKNAYFERHPDKARFYTAIRNEYLQIAEEEPHRFKIINADQKPEKVWADCQAQIDRFLAT